MFVRNSPNRVNLEIRKGGGKGPAVWPSETFSNTLLSMTKGFSLVEDKLGNPGTGITNFKTLRKPDRRVGGSGGGGDR